MTAYRFLVSAPSDIEDQDIEAVSRAVARWNVSVGPQTDAVVVPRHWKTAAAAEHGVRPQASLNEQLVEGVDIVVALFWHRLGSPTGESDSGTVEELERAATAGAYVAILTCERPYPTSVDLEQLQALRDFQERHRGDSLMLGYDTPANLESQIETILARAVSMLGAVPQRVDRDESGSSVWPSIRELESPRTDAKGKTTVDRRWRLLLTNQGSAPARQVKFLLEADDEELQPPRVVNGGEEPLEVLAPGGEVPFNLSVHMGVAAQLRCTVTWLDGDEERQHVATLRLF